MFPQIQVNQANRPKRPRFRPITQGDTAATTGLAVNPVGAMIPTTGNAMYGAQGQYGAMLPQVNVQANVSNLPMGTRYQGAGSFLGGNKFNPVVNTSGWNQQKQQGGGQYLGQGVYLGGNGATPGSNYSAPVGGANTFTGGGGSAINLQPGMNNEQFIQTLGERILQDPTQFDNLPPATQDAIRQSLGQGTASAPDESQSPGGRFTQVGDVKWERNKHGRLVKVQYTGGGSWRNKRVVQGGKGQGKRNLAYKQAQQVQPGNAGFIPSYGVVSFNTATG